MNDEINYNSNPLHGVGLKALLTEIIDHYGFEILFAYLNINCFNKNPSIASCVKFLKKTDWAREKVEAFYLYEFKNLPRASAEQFLLSPRDRVIPQDQTPGEPARLSLEDAERMHEKRAEKSAKHGKGAGYHSKQGKNSNAQRDRKDEHEPQSSASSPVKDGIDPWAKRKKKPGY